MDKSNINKVREIRDLLLKQSFTYDENVRSEAVKRLASMDRKEVIISLIKIIDIEKNNQILSEAIQLVIDWKVKEAIPLLMRKINGVKDTEIRLDIISALGYLDAKQAISKLIRLIRWNRDKDVKEVAINALGEIGGEKVIKFLTKLMRSNKKLRFSAFKELYYLESENAKEYIERIFENEDIAATADIFEIFLWSKLYVNVNLDKYIPLVISKIIKKEIHDESVLRLHYTWGLEHFDSKKTNIELIKAYKESDNIRDRHNLIYLLGQLESQEALPVFLEITQNENEDIKFREEALKFLNIVKKETNKELGKVKEDDRKKPEIEKTSLTFNERIANEKDDIGRLSAIEEFVEIGDKKAISLLLDLMENDPDDRIRRKAFFIVRKLNIKKAIITLFRMIDKETNQDILENIFTTIEAFGKESIQGLIKLLKNSKNKDFRKRAVNLLYKFEAKEAIPTLKYVIENDEFNEVRSIAIRMLGVYADKESIPLLVNIFEKDSYWSAQREAFKILVKLKAKDAILSLVPKILDEDSGLVNNVSWFYEKNKDMRIIPYLPLLLEKTEEDYDKHRVLQLFDELEASEHIPSLVVLLETKTELYIKQAIISMIGKFRYFEAIPTLKKLLKIRKLRPAIFNVFYELNAKETAPLIAKIMMKDKNSRPYAVAALVKFGAKEAKEAIPYLLDDLRNSKDERIRHDSASVLGYLEAKEAIPILREKMLTDENAKVREYSADSLGYLKAQESFSDLLVALKTDFESDVRSSAAYALGLLKNNEAIPHLMISLENDKFARSGVALALRELGVKEAESTLLSILRDEIDPETQRYIIYALGQIGEKETVPVLIDLIKTSKEKQVQRQAIIELGNLKTKEVIPLLEKELKLNTELKEDLITAIGNIGGNEAIEVLVNNLDNEEDPEICNSYIDSLYSQIYSLSVIQIRKIKDKLVKIRNKNNALYFGAFLSNIGEKEEAIENFKLLISEENPLLSQLGIFY